MDGRKAATEAAHSSLNFTVLLRAGSRKLLTKPQCRWDPSGKKGTMTTKKVRSTRKRQSIVEQENNFRAAAEQRAAALLSAALHTAGHFIARCGLNELPEYDQLKHESLELRTPGDSGDAARRDDLPESVLQGLPNYEGLVRQAVAEGKPGKAEGWVLRAGILYVSGLAAEQLQVPFGSRRWPRRPGAAPSCCGCTYLPLDEPDFRIIRPLIRLVRPREYEWGVWYWLDRKPPLTQKICWYALELLEEPFFEPAVHELAASLMKKEHLTMDEAYKIVAPHYGFQLRSEPVSSLPKWQRRLNPKPPARISYRTFDNVVDFSGPDTEGDGASS